MNGGKTQTDGQRILEKAHRLKSELKKLGKGKGAEKGGNRQTSSTPTPSPRKGGGGSDGDAKARAQGSGGVVGLGAKLSEGVRPDANKNGTGAARTLVKLASSAQPLTQTKAKAIGVRFVEGSNEAGHVVARVKVETHPDRAAAYTHKRVAPLSLAKAKVAYVAQGSILTASEMVEHEFLDKDGKHVRAEGRMWLGQASAGAPSITAEDLTIGARLNGGYWIIDPSALGGRLADLAETYGQHKANKMRMIYAPCVPTDTSGAIAFTFSNDMSRRCDVTGEEAFTDVSLRSNFVQTPVWESCAMEIVPSDITQKYFNSDSGDTLLGVQGAIEAVAASTLDPGSTQVVYGNLFLEYDVEFFDSQESYENTLIKSPMIRIDMNGSSLNPGVPFRFKMQATTAANTNGVISPPITGPAKDIYYGEVVDQTGYLGQGGSYTYYTTDDPEQYGFVAGQVFFIVFLDTAATANWTNGTIYGVLFTSLDTAREAIWSNPAGAPGDGQSGLVINGVTASAQTGDIRLRIRQYPMKVSANPQ